MKARVEPRPGVVPTHARFRPRDGVRLPARGLRAGGDSGEDDDAVIFGVCRSCYGGQAYCGDRCRERGRRQRHRAANGRYERTPWGRDDHRDRQREYRERQRLIKQVRSSGVAPAVVSPLRLMASDFEN